ncbi:glycosyltransferase 87 family protein [Streptomyces gilvosporeus]|uniref:glycosyltransferase 87 family protein n=1 Tax=Streptomyces gilvosporeus TaxID=553510 RepID=UPI00131D443A|nr:glycosyltransferase 87 family protein [Streptomyces gilvosporeus]
MAERAATHRHGGPESPSASRPPHLLSGDLYAFRLYLPDVKVFPLPFTYPPFAAVLFLPLAAPAWPVASAAWTLVSILALIALVHRSLRMAAPWLPAARHRQRVLLWSAVLLWSEPVSATLGLGQINLLLAALVLLTVQHRSPAPRGRRYRCRRRHQADPRSYRVVHLLAHGRWRAALWSLVAFTTTVAAGWLAAPGASRTCWFHLIGDTSRFGPIGSGLNQSLRGALSRALGHDAGWTAPWWALALLAAVAALSAATRSARRADLLGSLVAVQLLGLLVSPISWVHHWVWAVPPLCALLTLAALLRPTPKGDAVSS